MLPRLRFGKSREFAEPTPDWSGGGPGLFAQLYLALLGFCLLFVYAVHGRHPEGNLWFQGLAFILVLTTLATANLRPLLLDYYMTFGLQGRIGFLLAIVAFAIAPFWIEGHRVIPEGLALALIPLMLFAVDEAVIRRLIAFLIVSVWLLGFGPNPPELELVLVLGAAALWALAATHFTFTGEPFGLRGWWPFRRIAWTVALYSAPAALAAYTAHELWPDGRSMPLVRGLPKIPGAPAPSRELAPLKLEELEGLAYDTILFLAILLASLIALYFLRRYLAGRGRPAALPIIPGTKLSELELSVRPRAPEQKKLAGRRGKILRLWAKWAREQEAAGVPRSPSETAAGFAGRLAREQAEREPPESLTRLMEKAHYSDDEPTDEEVETMQEIVEQELRRGG